MNYSEAWSDLLGLPRLEKPVTANFENAKVKFPNTTNQKNEILKAINKFDDFIIVQFWGGQTPLVQVPVGQDEKGNKFPDWRQVPYNYENEPLRRHYPIEKAQKFVDTYAGTGRIQFPNSKTVVHEFITLPFNVGKTFDRN